MRFADRKEAGARLAHALEPYRENAIVYPLPRGGVVTGVEVARRLELPVDLIIPRKIGHPLNPEYAICAVSEAGELVCHEEELAGLDPAWLQGEVAQAMAESRRRRELYLGGRAPLVASHRTAILVDDGIATGLTMRATIRDARLRAPARVVVAVPIAPRDSADVLRRESDALVALDIPVHYLGAVGAYYDDFRQVSDDMVIGLLAAQERGRTARQVVLRPGGRR